MTNVTCNQLLFVWICGAIGPDLEDNSSQEVASEVVKQAFLLALNDLTFVEETKLSPHLVTKKCESSFVRGG